MPWHSPSMSAAGSRSAEASLRFRCRLLWQGICLVPVEWLIFGSGIVTDRLVIIGAGQAGFALAAKLRALKDERPITLIGAEDVAPYQRPPLSKKYLLGEMS